MAKVYSAAHYAFLKCSVRAHTTEGKIDWEKVLKEVSEESGEKQTLGAVKMRYRRLISQESVRPSSRAGDKTLKRTVKWLENILESNQRMRTQLHAKKGKRRNSARTELLKKKNKELRDQIIGLKDQLKSQASAVRFYAQIGKTFTDPKVQKAIINKG